MISFFDDKTRERNKNRKKLFSFRSLLAEIIKNISDRMMQRIYLALKAERH